MLSEQNIEAELSYAWIHAVAAHAGCSCEYRNRHLDAASIDATITCDTAMLVADAVVPTVSLDIQLKATRQLLPDLGDRFTFPLDVKQHEKLRQTALVPMILVVLRLPPEPLDWLNVTEAGLCLRDCAYWVSLKDDAASRNRTAHTVYLRKTDQFTSENLRQLLTTLARTTEVRYDTGNA